MKPLLPTPSSRNQHSASDTVLGLLTLYGLLSFMILPFKWALVFQAPILVVSFAFFWWWMHAQSKVDETFKGGSPFIRALIGAFGISWMAAIMGLLFGLIWPDDLAPAHESMGALVRWLIPGGLADSVILWTGTQGPWLVALQEHKWLVAMGAGVSLFVIFFLLMYSAAKNARS